jgi:hypothetical protein
MPEPLWTEAVALAQEHGLHWMSEALRVSYRSLKERVAQAPPPPRSKRSSEGTADERLEPVAPAFVELCSPAGLVPTVSGGAEVELVRPDGTKLTVRLAASSELDVAAVMSAFQRGGR